MTHEFRRHADLTRCLAFAIVWAGVLYFGWIADFALIRAIVSLAIAGIFASNTFVAAMLHMGIMTLPADRIPCSRWVVFAGTVESAAITAFLFTHGSSTLAIMVVCCSAAALYVDSRLRRVHATRTPT